MTHCGSVAGNIRHRPGADRALGQRPAAITEYYLHTNKIWSLFWVYSHEGQGARRLAIRAPQTKRLRTSQELLVWAKRRAPLAWPCSAAPAASRPPVTHHPGGLLPSSLRPFGTTSVSTSLSLFTRLLHRLDEGREYIGGLFCGSNRPPSSPWFGLPSSRSGR